MTASNNMNGDNGDGVTVNQDATVTTQQPFDLITAAKAANPLDSENLQKQLNLLSELNALNIAIQAAAQNQVLINKQLAKSSDGRPFSLVSLSEFNESYNQIERLFRDEKILRAIDNETVPLFKTWFKAMKELVETVNTPQGDVAATYQQEIQTKIDAVKNAAAKVTRAIRNPALANIRGAILMFGGVVLHAFSFFATTFGLPQSLIASATKNGSEMISQGYKEIQNAKLHSQVSNLSQSLFAQRLSEREKIEARAVGIGLARF